MDIPDSDEDFDFTLRHVTRRFPEDLARALLPKGTVITSARWSDTQITSRQRRLDRGLEVVADGKRRFEHTEWQVEMTADMPFRLFEYNALASLALATDPPAGEEAPRIQSTLVLLSGREKPWPAHGEYRTSPEGEPFSGVTYRIDAVYQRTVAELCARGPLWAIFAPLAVDADPVRMREVLENLRATHSPRDFGELAVALTVMATKDKRQRGLREGILAVLTEEEIMQSSVYEMGELKTLVRGCERRLRRTLTESERGVIAKRFGTLGMDRLLDLQQELSPDAFAAWLADPSAA